MDGRKRILVLFLISVAVLSACSPPAAQAVATTAPTQIVEPAYPPPSVGLPLTERDVPRVSVEEARAALDSDAAIVVDVRSPDAYETSHVAGAINVPLIEIERDPAGLDLPKEEWIITYCT
jgi:3-mercaptopyruvate sulfurtransferase SseA